MRLADYHKVRGKTQVGGPGDGSPATPSQRKNDDTLDFELSPAEAEALRISLLKQRVSWRSSSEYKIALLQGALCVIAATVLAYYSFYRFNLSKGRSVDLWDWWTVTPLPKNVGYFSIASAITGGVLAALLYQRQHGLFTDKHLLVERQAALERAEAGLHAKDDPSASPDFLQLWAITQKRLDYYHDIATAQARQSFRNAQFAMAAGFAVVVAAVAFTFRANNTASAAITGGLGAAGAALAAYIGRTFVKTQEESAKHLRAYFAQPLELSRYLLVERVLERASTTARDEATKDIAVALLTGNTPDSPSQRDGA